MTDAVPPGPDNTIGYCGYVYSPQSQKYCARFRWYEPTYGRWIERDPAGYVDGFSLYEYVSSDPRSFVDPYGLEGKGLLGSLLTALGFGSSEKVEERPPANLAKNLGAARVERGQLSRQDGSTNQASLEAMQAGYNSVDGLQQAMGPVAEQARAHLLDTVTGGASLPAIKAAGLFGILGNCFKGGVDDAAKAAGKGVDDAAQIAAAETRFINGVKVIDKKTGKVLQGTVDLKPTLDRIRSGGSHPHKRDGTNFENRPLPGRISPELPARPTGYYTEYVHPTPGVNGPDPQRVVVGRGGEMYYSPDHYGTFIPLNPK
ncbi:MAG: RHS repeat-associated core domain-containing protein [Planctomycetota bacterium]|nr:RHS repeat-associated core domain-containing protein [Planctomycetota bacterium]